MKCAIIVDLSKKKNMLGCGDACVVHHRLLYFLLEVNAIQLRKRNYTENISKPSLFNRGREMVRIKKKEKKKKEGVLWPK